jgi:AbrB family looped-hinge helix DNA binding protein
MISVIYTSYLKEVTDLKKQTLCSLEDQFLGTVTVGERGQVVIPAEARKKLDIHTGEKLLVISHPHGAGLVLAKIDTMTKFLSMFLDGLSRADDKELQEAHEGDAAAETNLTDER